MFNIYINILYIIYYNLFILLLITINKWKFFIYINLLTLG